MSVNQCSNVIVQGFTVDYDPLPFTQGVVTHNFFTSNDPVKEAAIEFQVDTNYPAPTNANYLDANASRWGMIIDPTQPGRVADGNDTQCFYTNVVQTNVNGAFKVYLTSTANAKTILPGSHWCMISRWDASILFNTFESSQVTYMSNTVFTAAGLVFVGEESPLPSEINDVIQPGPPPAGATAPRLRASNADGGLFLESRIGPWVQGCNYTGLSDDAANACVAPFITTNVPFEPTNSFELLCMNTVNGGPRRRSRCIAVSGRGGRQLQLFQRDQRRRVRPRHGHGGEPAKCDVRPRGFLNIVAGTYDTNTAVASD